MADKTPIEWTDATWNPVRGCSLVSAGCTNCYAMCQAHRQSGKGKAYEGLTRKTGHGPVWTGEIRLVPELLDLPLRWKTPRRIFVNSMSDLFHEKVPDGFIGKVFAAMGACEDQQRGHVFQILTKRPERMLAWVSEYGYGSWNSRRMAGERWPASNVWLGVSVEDQKTADERIPPLLQTPAAVRWISAEPLLGPIVLRRSFDAWVNSWPPGTHAADLPRLKSYLHWLVVGGESGPKARPLHPDWARSLRDQCQAAGVKFFFKQWGEWSPERPQNFCRLSRRAYSHESFCWAGDRTPYKSNEPDGYLNSVTVYRVGKKAAGAMLDGREWHQYPGKVMIEAKRIAMSQLGAEIGVTLETIKEICEHYGLSELGERGRCTLVLRDPENDEMTIMISEEEDFEALFTVMRKTSQREKIPFDTEEIL